MATWEEHQQGNISGNTLYLDGRILHHIPQSVCDNRHGLFYLHIQDNYLKDLSPIACAYKLQQLYAWSNEIEILPDFSRLPNLKSVDLRRNKIQTLPESIGNLTKLRNLSLHLNSLHSLPESFASLSSLEELDLGRNLFTHIPKSIRKLKSLKSLKLQGNSIETFSLEEGDLENLEVLDLNNCGLKELPQEITYLKKLRKISLRSNLLQSLPLRITSDLPRVEIDTWNNPLRMN
jgi:Leucine-rich repeat (LRR) protein